jgi:hypothetical protein
MMARFIETDRALVNIDMVARVEDCGKGVFHLVGSDGRALGWIECSSASDLEKMIIPAAGGATAIIITAIDGVAYDEVVPIVAWPDVGAEPVFIASQQTYLLPMPDGRFYWVEDDTSYANLDAAKAAILKEAAIKNGLTAMRATGAPSVELCFRDLAMRLFNNGYHVVPIAPKGFRYRNRNGETVEAGGKGPIEPKWQDFGNGQTADDVRRLVTERPDWGVGMLHALTPGIDIDVTVKAAADEIHALALDTFGELLVRYGRAPRRMLVGQLCCAVPTDQDSGLPHAGRQAQRQAPLGRSQVRPAAVRRLRDAPGYEAAVLLGGLDAARGTARGIAADRR